MPDWDDEYVEVPTAVPEPVAVSAPAPEPPKRKIYSVQVPSLPRHVFEADTPEQAYEQYKSVMPYFVTKAPPVIIEC